MSENKKKSSKRKVAKKRTSGTISLRQAREEAKKKKQRKKVSKSKTETKKVSKKRAKKRTADAQADVVQELSRRATPAPEPDEEAPPAIPEQDLDDPSLAANKAAEGIEYKQTELPSLDPTTASPLSIRNYLRSIADLPVNLRKRRYEDMLKTCKVSDSLYYRIFAKVPLSNQELISLIMTLNGKLKDDTISAVAEFCNDLPHVRALSIDRTIRFEDGKVCIVPEHGKEPNDKQVKSTVTKIRNSIVSRVLEDRTVRMHMESARTNA